MRGWIFSRSALKDLLQIWSYIAADNEKAADALEADIYAACDFLEENPGAGHKRPELTLKPVRFWTVRKRYVIVYALDSQLQIVRVLHGAQDMKTILGEEFDL